VHAEKYEAYRQARSQRDVLREPLVQAVRSLHKQATVDKAKSAAERSSKGRAVEREKTPEQKQPSRAKQRGKDRGRGGDGGRGLEL
jgi:hypothetical protein